jgi:O-antigen/teichoic acid export membrane protein
MTSYKKFTKNVGLVGIAQIVGALKGLILLPILTKTLGTEFYGIWAQIMVTVSLLMPLALLQLGFAMTRFLAAETDKEKISKGFYSIFAASSFAAFALSLLIFLLAEPLAVAVFGGADATYFVKLAAFLVLLMTLDQVIIEYFVAFRQMERYAVFMILQTIGEVLLIGYLVLSGYGLFGAIVSLLVVKAIVFAAGFLLIGREVGVNKPNISVIKSYLPFSLPMIPTTLCIWIVNLSDRYVIGYFLNIEAVGIYSAAYGLGCLVAFFFAPISTVLLPTITNLYENNDIQELKMHLKYSLKFFLMFAIPSLFGLSILSKSLLRTLTTSEFVGGYLIVPIVALATILFNCSSVTMNVVVLHKRTKLVGAIYAISASINMAMNIFLVLMIGILGAAIATLMTFAVHLSVVSIISFRSFSFDIDLKFIIKSVISSGVMGAIILKLNSLGAINILISIGIATVVYFGVLILLKGFTKEEYTFLKDILTVTLTFFSNRFFR